MFFKIGVRKYFANFTDKHRSWSLFLIKMQAFRTLLKLQVIFIFTEHLQWLLLDDTYLQVESNTGVSM